MTVSDLYRLALAGEVVDISQYNEGEVPTELYSGDFDNVPLRYMDCNVKHICTRMEDIEYPNGHFETTLCIILAG